MHFCYTQSSLFAPVTAIYLKIFRTIDSFLTLSIHSSHSHFQTLHHPILYYQLAILSHALIYDCHLSNSFIFPFIVSPFS